jgi:hypothetical protein
MKQGNLRNCTKLRNSLLGNGELASLAYGSFKELLKFKELLHIEVMILWKRGPRFSVDSARYLTCFIGFSAFGT